MVRSCSPTIAWKSHHVRLTLKCLMSRERTSSWRRHKLSLRISTLVTSRITCLRLIWQRSSSWKCGGCSSCNKLRIIMTRNVKTMMCLKCVDPQTPQHQLPLLNLFCSKRHATSCATICLWRCKAATWWPQWQLRCATQCQMLMTRHNPSKIMTTMTSSAAS